MENSGSWRLGGVARRADGRQIASSFACSVLAQERRLLRRDTGSRCVLVAFCHDVLCQLHCLEGRSKRNGSVRLWKGEALHSPFPTCKPSPDHVCSPQRPGCSGWGLPAAHMDVGRDLCVIMHGSGAGLGHSACRIPGRVVGCGPRQLDTGIPGSSIHD